jgi:hypothetical protein
MGQGAPLRILFFVHTLGRTRHFKSVIAGLTERGHAVVLVSAHETSPEKTQRGSYRDPLIEIATCPTERSDEWAPIAEPLRRTRDRLRFFDPRYARADKLAARAAQHTPEAWNQFVGRHPWLQRRWRLAQRGLAVAEDALPPDPGFLDFVRRQAPDLVLVTPLVEFGSYQTDYVKCAHSLGIPVAYLPFSWDNLTNRGLIRVWPDRALVWNHHQRREAIEMHGMPADRVVVTGAPRFDAFFRMKPSTSRDAFCRQLALDPARPLLLYVCSSGFVAPHEVTFVRRWADAIRRAEAPWLRDCAILVRPHPAYQEQWAAADLSDLAGVAVWAQRSSLNADRGLFDSLTHATAVVGLNTSAMIEAAIVGRPVYTIAADEFTGGQRGTLHFWYLLTANGGIVTMAESFEEHVRQLAAAPDEQAATLARSRRFLENFVRPRGLDVEVGDAMAEEVERVGRLTKQPRRTAPWHYPIRWGLTAAMRTSPHP